MEDRNQKPRQRSSRGYDLEKRCKEFAHQCRDLSKKLPRTVENIEDRKQLIRSSGSVGANYIEANESMSKKDFVYRIKISRKEAKESEYWLYLCECGKSSELEDQRWRLMTEAIELMKIFGAIYQNSK